MDIKIVLKQQCLLLTFNSRSLLDDVCHDLKIELFGDKLTAFDSMM